MTDEVVVRTTKQRLEQLLASEIDEVRLEVFESGTKPVPLSEVEYDMVCDIAGIVREIGDINHFTRKDGEEGQVRNIRIQDATSMIRCALWGDKADIDLTLGQPVILETVDINDGWQDEIEASVGWKSNIDVLEESEIDFVRVQLLDGDTDETASEDADTNGGKS